MSEERLQKILARAGVASRRKAEELIREGRVTINGRIAEIGDKADLQSDTVKMDARRIQAPAVHRYLLLNKPRGVMSTVSDPAGRPTVIDLVPPAMRRALAPVGRLDFHTEGLMLLTDDGELAQKVAHPSNGCWKTYEVKVRGRPEEEQIGRLRGGIVLEGRRTAPCHIAPLRRRPATGPRRGGPTEADTSSWWSVELGEGRTRQIREMFQRIGHPVQKLRRVAIGPISDPAMPVGMLRELSEREVAALRRAGPPAAPNKAPAASAARPKTLSTAPSKAPSTAPSAGTIPAAPATKSRPGTKPAKRTGPPVLLDAGVEVRRRSSAPGRGALDLLDLEDGQPLRAGSAVARGARRPSRVGREVPPEEAGPRRSSRAGGGAARGERAPSRAGSRTARGERAPRRAGSEVAPRPRRAAEGGVRSSRSPNRAGGGAARGERAPSRVGSGTSRDQGGAPPKRASAGGARGAGRTSRAGAGAGGGSRGTSRPGGGATRGKKAPSRTGATRGSGGSRGGSRSAGGRGSGGAGSAGGRGGSGSRPAGGSRPRRGGRG